VVTGVPGNFTATAFVGQTVTPTVTGQNDTKVVAFGCFLI
jgi:hypothetical protein